MSYSVEQVADILLSIGVEYKPHYGLMIGNARNVTAEIPIDVRVAITTMVKKRVEDAKIAKIMETIPMDLTHSVIETLKLRLER